MKSFFALTVVAMLAVASSTHVGNKNLFTDFLKFLIEKHRYDCAELHVHSIDFGKYGSVSNLLLENLETFFLERLDADGDLYTNIKNATVSLAVANATAEFNLVNVHVSEIGLTVNGAGSLTGSASGLRLTASIDFILHGTTVAVEDYSHLEITVGAIQALLTGINDADNTNAIINTKLAAYLTDNLPIIAEEHKPAIIAYINEFLAGLTH